jgi:dihydropyrimidinase
MTKLDTVIRYGEMVTAAGSIGRADIGIVGDLVVQIGGALEGSGKLILPGGIDAHVHLSFPEREDGQPGWVDDFTSGSAAALAGGITTLGNMTFLTPGETPLAGLERETAVARDQTIADLFLHPVLGEITPRVLGEIPKLLSSGCNSIKLFTVFPHFDSQVRGYVEAIQQAGASGLITLIHCEDYALIEAIAFAEATGAPVYIVHLSSKRALEVCAEAQSRGLPVYVETRPLYLHLTHERFEDEDGGKYVGQPPLREQRDVDALWAGIQQGVVHTVCTDHAPWSLSAKLDPAHTLTNLRPGVENLQTMLPMLYSEGVRAGRITLSRFIQVTSTNAAKLFGLYPRKGTIAVGSDADLVIFDPHLTRTVEGSMLKSSADYSVYEGWQVTGWPLLTLRRGEIVYRDDEVIGQPGSGAILPREATKPL